MSVQSLVRYTTFRLFQMLLRFTCASAFLLGAVLVTSASAQTITSTTAAWPSNIPSSPGHNTGTGGTCLPGDVNGDGATDIVCLNEDSNNPNYEPGFPAQSNYSLVPSSVFVLESTKGLSSGFGATTENGTLRSTSGTATTNATDGPGNETGACALGDFDGDGRDDLACFQTPLVTLQTSSNVSSENWPTVWFSTATPLSLEVANQNLTLPPQQENGQFALFQNPFPSYCYVGHFMASPGQQILCVQPALAYLNPNSTAYTYGPSNNYYVWRYVANYSASGTESITENEYNWIGPTNGNYSGVSCLAGDFNGDGLTDLDCGSNISLSTGTGFAKSTNWPLNDNSIVSDCTTGDFNGDGKTDYICHIGTGNTFHVFLSNGSGFQPYQTWTFSNMPAPQNPANQYSGGMGIFGSTCTTADLNGDGKTDLLCYANNSGNPAQWIYALSTGSGFIVNTFNSITPPSYSFRYPATYGKGTNEVTTSAIPFYWSCSLGNFMGNGIPDILCNPNTPMTSYSMGILSRQ